MKSAHLLALLLLACGGDPPAALPVQTTTAAALALQAVAAKAGQPCYASPSPTDEGIVLVVCQLPVGMLTRAAVRKLEQAAPESPDGG